MGNNGGWLNCVKCDSQNNVVATGYYYGTFNFGAQSLTSVLNSYDAFVAKYNSSGAPQWANSYGGPNSDGGTAVALDGAGNTIITGYFGGTSTIGGSTLTSVGGSDAFLLRRNP